MVSTSVLMWITILPLLWAAAGLAGWYLFQRIRSAGERDREVIHSAAEQERALFRAQEADRAARADRAAAKATYAAQQDQAGYPDPQATIVHDTELVPSRES